MRIMLQDYDDNPVIYSITYCAINKNPDTFYFTTTNNSFYKIVFNDCYINLESIMDSILQQGYYSIYRLPGYKVYCYSDIVKEWIDIKEGI